jgi:hypothetical protein
MANNRDVTPDNGKLPVIRGVKCKDCVGFNRYAKYDDLCEKLGVQSYSKPCSRFDPDPKKLGVSDIKLLAEVIDGMATARIPLITSMLNREHITRTNGFHMGQKVYVRVLQGSGDYLSNYGIAKVISADSKYVHVQGKGGFRASVYHVSVLTLEQFEKKRRRLQKAGKLKDPNLKKPQTKTSLKKVNYTPPTLEEYERMVQREKTTKVVRVRRGI